MSPPGRRAHTATPGGTTSPGRHEQAVRAAHKALSTCGVIISPARVNRILRGFEKRARRDGISFHEFLCGEADLTPLQRHRLAGNPDLALAISYADPTGETAVNNVMRGGRTR